MTDKEIFIMEVEKVELSEKAKAYFETLKTGKKAKEKVEITENGKIILKAMKEIGEAASAKVIGESLRTTGRKVSGCLRKLVTEGYVQKIGENPIQYELTEKGLSYKE